MISTSGTISSYLYTNMISNNANIYKMQCYNFLTSSYTVHVHIVHNYQRMCQSNVQSACPVPR